MFILRIGKCVLMPNRDIFKLYLTGKETVHLSEEIKMHLCEDKLFHC